MFLTMRRETGSLTLGDLPSRMSKLKNVGENLTEDERAAFLHDSYQNLGDEVDFELFLQVYSNLQAHATSRMGKGAKNSSAFLKSPTSTLLHSISESEKASYVGHINNYLGEDRFLKKFLPIDPSTNDLFEIAKDGVLICWFRRKKGDSYLKRKLRLLQVDKQVAAVVKAAFVRLSTCVCIGDQEFKQILKKNSQNPDLDVKLHR
ncbi:putative CH domain superfamily, fimbrin/Plastin [Helianthus annuus]|uniref:CH domain superfamily, fimbrin/Plastin n=1 Tax=Helianthus annuus TaxID=4232 RepID=A0A9K3GZA3_HELAN|nr:putative CH domain superfamily, fimbrin/Plastin [Helianthus annuus]KAJ0822575.1 putative CH domain superfamily, fimbrin/Plastin [Helianthus annuus]